MKYDPFIGATPYADLVRESRDLQLICSLARMLGLPADATEPCTHTHAEASHV